MTQNTALDSNVHSKIKTQIKSLLSNKFTQNPMTYLTLNQGTNSIEIIHVFFESAKICLLHFWTFRLLTFKLLDF
jgi:hypothetical protein